MKCDIVRHMAEAWTLGKDRGQRMEGTRERPWEGEHNEKNKAESKIV